MFLERFFVQSISCFQAIRVLNSWLNEKPFNYLYSGSNIGLYLMIAFQTYFPLSVVRYIVFFSMVSIPKRFPLMLGVLNLHSWSYPYPFIHWWFSDSVICYFVIYAVDATDCSKHNRTSDLWKQIEYVSEFEYCGLEEEKVC